MKLTGEGLALDPKEIELEMRERRPMAYLQPLSRAADLSFIPLSHPGAICCLAMRRDQVTAPNPPIG